MMRNRNVIFLGLASWSQSGGSNACNPWLPLVHCLGCEQPEELEKASHMKSFRSWMGKDREQKLCKNPWKRYIDR